MGKFDGILICTDLDGTFVNSKGSVSKENTEAVKYFKSQNGIFTIASGRSPQSIETLIDKSLLDISLLDVPVICMNGATIYDYKNRRFIWGCLLGNEIMPIINHTIEKFPKIGIELYKELMVYICKTNKVIDEHVAYEKLDVRHTPHLVEELQSDSIAKVLFAATSREIDHFMEGIKDHPDFNKFTFMRSCGIFYELLNKQTNKGVALDVLAESIGILPKNTVAVGDNDNDIELIKHAGISFAVDNAIPSLKAVANHLAPNNNEHALAYIVEHLDMLLSTH